LSADKSRDPASSAQGRLRLLNVPPVQALDTELKRLLLYH